MIRFLILWLLVAAPLAAQATFTLRNTDLAAVFYWWEVETTPNEPQVVLGGLSAAGPGHPVAPGETVAGNLGPGRRLVGAFVPWVGTTNRSIVVGGFLLASELPSKGTLLVDRPGFAASNRGRELSGTLAEWGLVPPSLVLDGHSDDWRAVPLLREWGPAFQPEEGPWPPGFLRLRTLQAADRDGAFWLRVVFDGPATAAGPSGSLLLTRPGASLEFPLVGVENRVWQWRETSSLSVGSRVISGGVLEAWVPWDRLPAADREAWLKVPGEWVLAVMGPGSAVRTYRLGAFFGEDLP